MHSRRTAPHPGPLPIGWGEGEWLAATHCRATRGLSSMGFSRPTAVPRLLPGSRAGILRARTSGRHGLAIQGCPHPLEERGGLIRLGQKITSL